MKLALAVMSVFAAIVVSGASAADFDGDGGPCTETPGEGALLRCPTAFVGEEYEVQIESEEGSGCTSPGNPYVWYEVVNSSLPPGLTMTRAGVISGVPTQAGFVRFWLWNHDLTAAQGGPSWCQHEDRSEREFSIYVDPGLEIANEDVAPATLGQPYTQTLTANRIVSLNPTTGNPVQAAWSLQSGALPPGLALSANGALTGTPTTEGGYEFVVKAQYEAPVATQKFTLTVRQPLVVKSPFVSTNRPSAEVGIRFGRAVSATGGSGAYTWSLSSGALPPGLALDPAKGALSGAPRTAGTFTFGLKATDTDGRTQTVNAALRVAPRLAIRPLRAKAAAVGSAYRATLGTTGGVAPLTWRVARGKLPSGVRLSPTLGTLSGTPTRAGTFRVVVEARDALGAKSRATLVLSVTG
jgi:hypothetical protein